MVIKVLDYVDQCQSNGDGIVIHDIIKPKLENGEEVVLSFEGVPSLPSSFVNSALISLLDEMPFERIKSLLRFVHTNSQMNSMIRDRFGFEVKRHSTALA
ncbi:MAG: STAS-like domain-containing protein [Burkholderiaceae bacterium]